MAAFRPPLCTDSTLDSLLAHLLSHWLSVNLRSASALFDGQGDMLRHLAFQVRPGQRVPERL